MQSSRRWGARCAGVVLAMGVLCGTMARATESGPVPWEGTAEQKAWGVMVVWAEVREAFAFFDRVPALDWDSAARAALTRAMAAPDLPSYYDVLRELVARLEDGHTVVRPPAALLAALDRPPLELEAVGGTIIVTRVGASDELERLRVRVGDELVSVDGVPARRYLEERELRLYRGGTRVWAEAFGLHELLDGPRDSLVAVVLRSPTGASRELSLTRSTRLRDGATFVSRIREVDAPVEVRELGDRILYARLPTFEDMRVARELVAALEKAGPSGPRGLILDVRHNIGGSSSVAEEIVAHLTDRPLLASRWRTRVRIEANRAWGQPEQWLTTEPSTITPATNAVFTGPLVVLTGHDTFSSAEDFLVPLDASRRAVLVGATSAGSTGQPLVVALPGGGRLLVCAKRDSYPDGREFMGTGIVPQVTIEPTRADIVAGRDVALDKALEVIRSWSRYRPVQR